MRAKQLTRILNVAFRMREPALVVGAPGIGKTDVITQVAEANDADVILTHPVVQDPTDYKGLPWPSAETGEARFLPFGDLARAMRATRPTVWFLDDLGQAPNGVQAAAMQLLLAREVNGQSIPDCVTFMAASNRRADRAGVGGLLEPLKSRFATIVELEANVIDWLDWAVTHGVVPEVMAYLRLKPEALSVFAPTGDMTNSPSPRTWAKVSKWMAAGLEQRDQFATFSGAIGAAHAQEFCTFLTMYRSLVSPDAVLLDPKGAPVPTDTSALYAIATALGYIANPRNFGRILDYALRMPQEFGVLCVRECEQRNPEVKHSADWVRYTLSPLGKLVAGVDE